MKVVSTSNAPAAIGPYSQALDLGSMVFVSGQIPVDPATGTMADTVEEQAAQSLANLKAILAEAGLTMGKCGQDGHLPGRHQRLCCGERCVCQGIHGTVPGPQLRAGGRYPQGRKARDRVHRRAGVTHCISLPPRENPIHKRGCAIGTASFACMRKKENGVLRRNFPRLRAFHSTLTARRARKNPASGQQLSEHRITKISEWRDLNSRPPAPKAGALPTAQHPGIRRHGCTAEV